MAETRHVVRLACTQAAAASAQSADLMFNVGGGTSLYEECPLERCFRDVHAITQHMAVAPANYDEVERGAECEHPPAAAGMRVMMMPVLKRAGPTRQDSESTLERRSNPPAPSTRAWDQSPRPGDHASRKIEFAFRGRLTSVI